MNTCTYTELYLQIIWSKSKSDGEAPVTRPEKEQTQVLKSSTNCFETMKAFTFHGERAENEPDSIV